MVTQNKRYDPCSMTSEKEMFIVQQLAKLKGPSEIVRLYNAKYPRNKPINIQTVHYFKKTRLPAVDNLKEKFLEKKLEIPIASEAVRLKRTEDLYNAAAEVVGEKDIRVLQAIGVSLNCLKEAREELKGEGSTQNYVQFNQYNELSDEQLMDKQKELEKKFLDLDKKGEQKYG